MRFSSLARLFVAIALSAFPAGARAQVGTAAPEIDLRTLTGARFQLSGLKGHPVVLTFWGSWCPPCREEFPELANLYRKHHADGLEVVAVNQRDQEWSTEAVQRFVDELAAPFTVVLDLRGRSRRAYRLVGLPTTVFIDTAGVIRYSHPGPISREDLAKGLATIGIAR